MTPQNCTIFAFNEEYTFCHLGTLADPGILISPKKVSKDQLDDFKEGKIGDDNVMEVFVLESFIRNDTKSK